MPIIRLVRREMTVVEYHIEINTDGTSCFTPEQHARITAGVGPISSLVEKENVNLIATTTETQTDILSGKELPVILDQKALEGLDAFQCWMVKENIQHARKEGKEVVLNRLRAQGFNLVANAVEKHEVYLCKENT